jgi:UDP-N-acetylmuramoyl-L-alanyl-D-glutamate--2,6-diaminopimelate ligase
MQTLHSPQQAAQWLRATVKGQLHIDSRKVRQGDGFLAWPGMAHDARHYVTQALAQGASACLVEAKGVDAFEWTNDTKIAAAGGSKTVLAMPLGSRNT